MTEQTPRQRIKQHDKTQCKRTQTRRSQRRDRLKTEQASSSKLRVSGKDRHKTRARQAEREERNNRQTLTWIAKSDPSKTITVVVVTIRLWNDRRINLPNTNTSRAEKVKDEWKWEKDMMRQNEEGQIKARVWLTIGLPIRFVGNASASWRMVVFAGILLTYNFCKFKPEDQPTQQGWPAKWNQTKQERTNGNDNDENHESGKKNESNAVQLLDIDWVGCWKTHIKREVLIGRQRMLGKEQEKALDLLMQWLLPWKRMMS